MATTAAVLEYIVTANTAQANAALAKTQGQLVTMGKTSKASGAAVKAGFAAVGVAAVGAAAALFKVGEEFDKVYDKIQTQTGATGKEMDKLEKSFKNVVKTVPTDFDSAATAVAGLNQRLGETGKPLTTLARQVTALAKITGEDVQENVEAVTRLFGDWGVATKDQTKTLDGLFRVGQKTGATVSDLARNMVQFGAPLRNLGFELDQAAAMFGAFEKTGVNITTVLSGLRLSVGNFAKPTDDLAKTMDKLNLSAKDTPGAIVEMFKQIKTLKSESEATALAIDAFGKRAGPDLVDTIRGGKFELDDLIKTFNSGNGTIRKAERSTRDFAEQWTLFKNNLAVAIEPAARKVFKAVGDMMKDVTNVLTDKNLSWEEKWQKLADMALGVFSDLIAKAGEMAPKIAGAFVKGFLDAPILGKLLLGGWLLSKMGGMGAISKIGTSLGMSIGRFAGPAVAVAIGAALGAEFGKGDWAQKHIAHMSDITEKIAEELGVTLKQAQKVETWMRTHPGLSAPEAFREMHEAAQEARQKVLNNIDILRNRWGASLGEIKQRTQQNMADIRRTMDENSMKGRIAIMNNFDAAVDAIKRSMEAGKTSANEGAKAIHRILIKQLKSYGISDPEGFLNRSEAETNTQQQLGQTGQQNNGGSGGGHMRGGIIAALAAGGMVPGYGSGDKVPLHIGGKMAAMVEPGEYVSVANKRATAALMQANDAVPRFAKGGTIPGDVGGLNPGIMALLNSLYSQFGGSVTSGYRAGAGSLHATSNAADYVPSDWKGASAAANAVGSKLLEGIYNPVTYGGTAVSWDTGSHVSPSFWGAETWAAHWNHLHLAIAEGMTAAVGKGKGAVASLAEKVNLPRFEGTNGIGGLVATGLNKVAMGAEQQTNAALAARNTGSGTLGSTVATGPIQQMAHEMITRMWGESQWPPFVSLEMAEAGWDPRAVNPSSGAAGLAQALPPSKYPPGAWPYQGPESAKLQLQWMTGYIRDRYGDPASAWAFHQSHNWYKQGGVVGKGQNYGSREMAQYLLEMGKAHGYLTSSEVGLWNGLKDKTRLRFGHRMNRALNPSFLFGEDMSIKRAHGNPTQGGNTHFAKGGVLKPGEQGGVVGTNLNNPFTQAWLGAQDPFEGGTSYTPADIPKKVQDMLDAYTGAISLLDTQIGLAEHFASYNSSEAGADLGPLEVAEQLFLNQQLLTNLEGLRDWATRGLGLKRTSRKGKAALQAILDVLLGGPSVGIEGGGGSLGRILETKARIDELQHPEFAETEGQQFLAEYFRSELLKANQRFGVSQAQYGVFRDFAGGFQGGGYIPMGKWGVVGESGPEVVGGPTSVAQMGGDGVTVVVNGDIINTPPGMQPVEVQGAKTIVQQGSRGYGRRPLGSARGY